MQHCLKCDQRNALDARFCIACGAQLGASGSQPVPPPLSQALPQPVPPARSQALPQPVPPPVGRPLPQQVPYTPAAPAMPAAPALAAAGPAYGAPLAATYQQVNIHIAQQPETNLLVRALYFFFVGWWFSQIWLIVAWLFNLTIIGLPVGLAMLNHLPQVVTLKSTGRRLKAYATPNGGVFVAAGTQQQPFLLRALYFVFVGWWVSFIWAQIAWALSVSIIGLPVAFLMFDFLPTITTLRQH